MNKHDESKFSESNCIELLIINTLSVILLRFQTQEELSYIKLALLASDNGILNILPKLLTTKK
jgi:hypothetical protein